MTSSEAFPNYPLNFGNSFDRNRHDRFFAMTMTETRNSKFFGNLAKNLITQEDEPK